MFTSVGIVLVSNKILAGTGSNSTQEFFIKQLNLLNYQIEKLLVTIESENILTKELDTLSKQYDVLIVVGELKDDVILKSLGNLCSDELKGNNILKSKHDSLPKLPSAVKLLTNGNLLYPVIYLQRIFILKEKCIEAQYFEVLKSHLEQYVSPTIFKKYIQVHMNGNTKKILDCLSKLVTVEIQNETSILTLTVSSINFENIVKAEEMLKNELHDNFIESTEDGDFLRRIYDSNDEHILNSLEVVHNCISSYGPDNIFLSFNGGKDCTVLLHLVYTVLKIKYPDYKKRIFCLYVKSQEPFPEQDLFISQCRTFYNLDIMVVSLSIKEALKQVLAVKPNLKAGLMGTRRTDPFSEHLVDFQMTDPDWPQVMRVSPLLDWHYTDIWDYLLFYKVPYCKLYDLGFTSIGNSSNTIRNPSLCYFDVKLNKQVYLPAYKLMKESEERSGRNVVSV